MRTPALLLAAFAVTASSRAPAGVIPPANGYKVEHHEAHQSHGDGLEPPQGVADAGEAIDRQRLLQGEAERCARHGTSTPVNQTGNTFEVQFVVPNTVGGSTTHTKAFPFELVAGKTANTQTKFNVSTGDTATWGKVLSPGDAIEIRAVRVIQGGSGLGAGNVFGVAGLTTK